MQQITEDSGVHAQWYTDAKSVTVDTLGDFVKRLTSDYEHDYGTICHAIAASMCAAMNAADNSPQGGITGFQASAIMWGVLQNAFHVQGPHRLLNYNNLLYPQYADHFTHISPETWAWVRTVAQERLIDSDRMHPAVREHMLSIAEHGVVPFGLKVKAA